ncbi:hypothetical protein AT728_35615 [Streptomyces silvensis]|uniref:ATP-grasp-modified RiPP n=2 Tax=Streptomyces TaxID=1883 RepID=A0A0W7WW91_9ACTN|nr:putative ATP-grasp-modified RiPP [Streptomyces typhae]KUF14847.1 hypothetical protein AT728_35615 [Streptomyces silvensis]
MRPYPDTVALPAAEIILDPETQTGRFVGPDGLDVPRAARHKRTETSKETSTRTSLDGTTDEGSDQEGDTD